jgi:CTP:molybdopterin cytidylyltransferase MocA
MPVLLHAVVLLAAGESRRLGRPKQLLEIDGEPLVRRGARLALGTAPSQTVVVVGAQADRVWEAVADLPVVRADCPDWSSGLSASIRAGIGRVDREVEGALILLCDQPALTAAHLEALVDRWRSHPHQAVACRYSGTVGVPAMLPRSWFGALSTLSGDRGARDLLRECPTEVVAIPADMLGLDVDVSADLDRLQP